MGTPRSVAGGLTFGSLTGIQDLGVVHMEQGEDRELDSSGWNQGLGLHVGEGGECFVKVEQDTVVCGRRQRRGHWKQCCSEWAWLVERGP